MKAVSGLIVNVMRITISFIGFFAVGLYKKIYTLLTL